MVKRALLIAVSFLFACSASSSGTDVATSASDLTEQSDLVSTEDSSVSPSDVASDGLSQGEVGSIDVSGGDGTVSPSSLVGTWAQMQHSATVTDSPLGGGTFNTLVHSLHLVVITLEPDGSLMAHHSMCDIQAESDFAQTETIIPAAYIHSLEPYSRKVTANWDTKEFTGARVTEVKGCVLDDPENDDLPTSEDDTRVMDQDGDGHPGMTLQISGLINGDLYVVERNWTELTGTFVNQWRIEGLLSWGVEQNKLGSSNPLLSMDIASWVDPDPNKSTFEMARVDDGDDCAELIAHQGDLFSSP